MPNPISIAPTERARAGSGVHRRPSFVLGSVSYEPIVHLGSGGMANVWLAAQRRGACIDRIVALKQPRRADREGGDRCARQALVREAWLASRARHPNVVQVFDILPGALALEWIQGGSLRELLGPIGAPIAAPLAIRVVLDVLGALSAVHAIAEGGERLGVVHRDCSPGNVLLGLDGRACLADFGLAASRSELARGSMPGIVGTPRYLAPEQARGEIVDERCDLFAAGTILWEMLTGDELLEGESNAEVLRYAAIGMASRRVANDVRAPVARELRHVLERALATSRSERWPTARAFAQALSAAGAASGGIASHEDVADRIRARRGEVLASQHRQIAEWSVVRADCGA